MGLYGWFLSTIKKEKKKRKKKKKKRIARLFSLSPALYSPFSGGAKNFCQQDQVIYIYIYIIIHKICNLQYDLTYVIVYI